MKLCGGWLPAPLANGLFYTHYPFAIHRPGGVPSCPHVSWVPGFKTIHDVNCFLGIPEGEAWCEPCSTMPENEDLRDVVNYAVAAKPGSSYLRLGISVLAYNLHDRRRICGRAQVRTLNLDRSIISLRRQVDISAKPLVSLWSGQCHRIGPFLDQQMSRGRSLHRCVSQLREAVAPQLTRKYTDEEHHMAMLTWCLGGWQLLHAFHRAGYLSPTTLSSKAMSVLHNPIIFLASSQSPLWPQFLVQFVMVCAGAPAHCISMRLL